MTIHPVADNILVRLEHYPTRTASGLHLPPPDRPGLADTRTAVIVAAGPGRYHPRTGVLLPTQVRVGERVLILATAGKVAQDWGMDDPSFALRGNAGADLDPGHRVLREDELIVVLEHEDGRWEASGNIDDGGEDDDEPIERNEDDGGELAVGFDVEANYPSSPSTGSEDKYADLSIVGFDGAGVVFTDGTRTIRCPAPDPSSFATGPEASYATYARIAVAVDELTPVRVDGDGLVRVADSGDDDDGEPLALTAPLLADILDRMLAAVKDGGGPAC